MQVDSYVASGSDSDYNKYWIDWFLSVKGNEYFCEIDEEYILDRFNLTDLNNEVQHYEQALDLITDNFEDEDIDANLRTEIEKSARHLYGLIHARFIITHRGLQKMLEKYKRGEFGRCPRVFCGNHPVLPVGLHDAPSIKSVKLFCPKCEDVYSPKSTRHASIDGAYFGTTFPHLLFQVYPNALPPRTQQDMDVYVPRIFGFKIHPTSGQLGRNALRQYMEAVSAKNAAAAAAATAAAANAAADPQAQAQSQALAQSASSAASGAQTADLSGPGPSRALGNGAAAGTGGGGPQDGVGQRQPADDAEGGSSQARASSTGRK